MAIAVVGNVHIVVRTRSEHCPPHVHAVCDQERWDARFRFAFVDAPVELWDVRPLKNRPTIATLKSVGQEVAANLAQIRRRWWEAMGTTCLENRSVQFDGDRVVLCDNRSHRGVKVVAAAFTLSSMQLTMRLSDGRTHVKRL